MELFSESFKTGSLDNLILEFLLDQPSLAISHYTMLYKYVSIRVIFCGIFCFGFSLFFLFSLFLWLSTHSYPTRTSEIIVKYTGTCRQKRVNFVLAELNRLCNKGDELLFWTTISPKQGMVMRLSSLIVSVSSLYIN